MVMIRRLSVRAAFWVVWFGLFGCEAVLGLSTNDPTLQAGGRAGAAGQAGSFAASGNGGTFSSGMTAGSIGVAGE